LIILNTVQASVESSLKNIFKKIGGKSYSLVVGGDPRVGAEAVSRGDVPGHGALLDVGVGLLEDALGLDAESERAGRRLLSRRRRTARLHQRDRVQARPLAEQVQLALAARRRRRLFLHQVRADRRRRTLHLEQKINY